MGQGGHAGNHAVSKLRVPDIGKIRSEIPAAIHVVHGTLAEDLGIPRPAQPLIPLGAIGGDSIEVVPLRPEGVAENLVDNGVGAMKTAGGFQIGVNDLRLNIEDLHLPDKLHFGVSEAVVSKNGTEDFGILSGQDVGIHGLGLPEIFGIKGSVFLQNFPVAENQFGTSLSFADASQYAGNLPICIHLPSPGKNSQQSDIGAVCPFWGKEAENLRNIGCFPLKLP